jgi:hypothetical protein
MKKTTVKKDDDLKEIKLLIESIQTENESLSANIINIKNDFDIYIELTESKIKEVKKDCVQNNKKLKDITPSFLIDFVETKTKKLNEIKQKYLALVERSLVVSEVQYFVRSSEKYSKVEQLDIANKLLYSLDLPDKFWIDCKGQTVAELAHVFHSINIPKTTEINKSLVSLVSQAETSKLIGA